MASLALASVASTAAKALFDRDRPPVTVHATTVTLAAFPSGHATDAAAFFLAASLTLSLTIAHHRWVQALLVAAGLFLAPYLAGQLDKRGDDAIRTIRDAVSRADDLSGLDKHQTGPAPVEG
jgi:hypothetical protein